jgi:hypothetical protein
VSLASLVVHFTATADTVSFYPSPWYSHLRLLRVTLCKRSGLSACSSLLSTLANHTVSSFAGLVVLSYLSPASPLISIKTRRTHTTGCIAVQHKGPVRAIGGCERRVEQPAAARVGILCLSRPRPRWARRLGITSTTSGQWGGWTGS